MNVYLVAEEIRAALQTIPDLRVPPWGVDTAQVPAAIVAIPQRIDFLYTYARGLDQIDPWHVVVLVGRADDRVALENLAPYADGAGPQSIKAVLESYTWTTCGDVTVRQADFDEITAAGTPYQAVTFELVVTGSGGA